MQEETYQKAKANRERLANVSRQLKQARSLYKWGAEKEEGYEFIVRPKEESPAQLPMNRDVMQQAMALYIRDREELLVRIEDEFSAL